VIRRIGSLALVVVAAAPFVGSPRERSDQPLPRLRRSAEASAKAEDRSLPSLQLRAPSPQPPAPSPQAGAGATFQDITQSAGVTFKHTNGASPEKFLVETMGSGGLFFDYDNDGWIDIFLVDGGSFADAGVAKLARHRLYRNRGNGTFADTTSAAGIVHAEYGMGACAGDYDNDGLVDLYVTNAGPNVLYRNTGSGRFTNVTTKTGVGTPVWSTSCAFSDVDEDGFLDLFVTNYLDAGKTNNRFCGDPVRRLRSYCHPLVYNGLPNVLYHNNRDGTFSDISAMAGIGRDRGNGLGVAIGDYDDDGWPDVFVANDTVPNFLFHNEGKGVFREAALVAGVAVATDGKARAGMGTEFADYDGDGRLDLVVTNHEFERTTLFRNLGTGVFADTTAESGVGPPTLPLVGFGTVLFDYDNDGHVDLAIVNGHVVDNTALFRAGSSYAQRRLLFHNLGNRRFSDVSASAGSGFGVEKVGRTLIAGDIDNDGDLDLLVTNTGQAVDLLRNDGGNRNNAVLIRLIGNRSNRDGLGARIRVTAGATTWMRESKSGSSYLGQNDTRVHVGVGQATEIDRIEVRWPSGATDTLSRVPVNSVITITEGQGLTKRTAFQR
jgi:enediyne biosynthesis protein E4